MVAYHYDGMLLKHKIVPNSGGGVGDFAAGDFLVDVAEDFWGMNP